MRKVLSGIVVIIVLVIVFLLAAPIYYGKQAQFFINKAVSSANQNYGKYGVHASVESYQRSWYTSTAVVDVAIDNAKLKAFYKKYVDTNFNLQHSVIYREVLTVSHGPVLYHFMSHNPLSAAYVTGYVELPADLERRLQLTASVLTFGGSISYAGVFTGNVDMPAFFYNSPQVTLKFQGLSFLGSMSSDLSHFAGHYTIQPLMLDLKNANQNAGLKIILSVIKTHFDFQRTPMGLWVGYTQSNLQSDKIILTTVSAQKTDHNVVQYNDVSTSTKLALVDNGYSFNYNTTIGSYQAFSRFKATNIKMNFDVNNLNAMVAQTIQELVLQRLSVGALQPDQVTLNEVTGLLPKLITNKTTVKINEISFDLPKGSVAVQGEFSWPGYEAGMPVFAMAMITHASLNVSAGKELVDQAIAQANKIAQEQAQATAAVSLPMMEPGPVILPAAKQGQPAITPAAVKPVVVKPTAAAPLSDIPPAYLGELTEASGLFQFCLAQGYISEVNHQYTTTLNYAAGNFTANGKQVKM